MQRRRQAREAALQVLFGLDITRGDVAEAVTLFWEMGACLEDQEEDIRYPTQVRPFATRLVMGTWQYREEIDDLIARSSEHWSLGRIACVERCILRMAVYELLYCDDIPPKVSMNEAIELGKIYGAENSGAFINGILDAIYNELKREGRGQKFS